MRRSGPGGWFVEVPRRQASAMNDEVEYLPARITVPSTVQAVR
jgi:hypothetical protein